MMQDKAIWLDIWQCIFPVVGKGNLPGKKISPEDLKWFQHHTSHSTKAIGTDYILSSGSKSQTQLFLSEEMHTKFYKDYPRGGIYRQ